MIGEKSDGFGCRIFTVDRSFIVDRSLLLSLSLNLLVSEVKARNFYAFRSLCLLRETILGLDILHQNRAKAKIFHSLQTHCRIARIEFYAITSSIQLMCCYNCGSRA